MDGRHSYRSFFSLLGGVTNICREKLDLGFILDRSGSIGSANFEKIKSFVKDLTGHFEVSQEYTRVSVMSYASSSTIHFPFSQQFPTKQDLHSAIDSISYNGGSTYTGQALTKAYTTMFNANNGARLSGICSIFFHVFDFVSLHYSPNIFSLVTVVSK